MHLNGERTSARVVANVLMVSPVRIPAIKIPLNDTRIPFAPFPNEQTNFEMEVRESFRRNSRTEKNTWRIFRNRDDKLRGVETRGGNGPPIFQSEKNVSDTGAVNAESMISSKLYFST